MRLGVGHLECLGLEGEGGFAGNLRRVVLYEAVQAVWFCFVFTLELSLEGGVFCPGT